jgi:hypothetical protein
MLKWRGKADVRFAETAKVPLSDAIQTAEHRLALSRLFRVGVPAVKGETSHPVASAISRLKWSRPKARPSFAVARNAYRNSASRACRNEAA